MRGGIIHQRVVLFVKSTPLSSSKAAVTALSSETQPCETQSTRSKIEHFGSTLRKIDDFTGPFYALDLLLQGTIKVESSEVRRCARWFEGHEDLPPIATDKTLHRRKQEDMKTIETKVELVSQCKVM